MMVAVLGALLAADPCAPLPAAIGADPADAAAYLEVAKEEESAGAWSSALEAYRRAAALAPEDAEARAGLQRACARRALDEAESLLQRGDSAGALKRLRGVEGDRPAALLEGSVLLDEGRLDEARGLLSRAHEEPQLRAAAALQLAVLELRAGRSEAAQRWLAEAGGERQTAETAKKLAPLLRADHRVRASGSLEAGYDSNPLLVPGLGLFGAAAPDGFTSAGVQAEGAPWGQTLPRVALRGAYRKYFSSDADDTGIAGAGVRWEPRAGPLTFAGGYDFDFVSFGVAPWLLRHAVDVSAGARWRRFTGGIGYQLRHETYLQPSSADDSGLRHAVRAWVGARLGPVDLEAAWIFTRAPLAVTWRGYSDDGGELWAALQLEPVTVVATGNLRRRTYDAVDPDLLAQRDDVLAEAELRVELALLSWLRLYLSGELRTARSNVDGLSFTRVAGLGGLTVSGGWL